MLLPCSPLRWPGGTLESALRRNLASKTGIKNVVLVHGAFADGSGWEAVAKILEDGWLATVLCGAGPR